MQKLHGKNGILVNFTDYIIKLTDKNTMDVFKFSDYRELIRTYIKSQPRKGRGEIQKISEALTIHPTSLSQILMKKKEFTLEQAGRLCKYLNLNEIESEYLICLVEIERAGSDEIRKIYESRRRRLLVLFSEVNQRVPKDAELSESNKALYYSHWYYSGIKLLCDIPGFQTPEAIADRLKLPVRKVVDALVFLTQIGFCIEENGLYKMGNKRNFIEKKSPLLVRHLNNWRQLALQRLDNINFDDEFVYSCPMTVSKNDRLKVRSILFDATQEILKLTINSPSEELVVLNLDWIRI